MSWIALLKKEWKASSVSLAINVIGLVSIFLIIFYAMGRYSPFLFMLGFVAFFALLLGVAIDFVHSLRKEWKENTVYVWMNLPIAGWKLLLSKLTMSLLQFAVYSAVTIGFMYILINRAIGLFQQNVYLQDHAVAMEVVKDSFGDMSLYFILTISFGAIFLAFGVVFIYLMTKVIRPLGWLVGTLVAGVFYYGYFKFLGTPVFSAMTEWGLIRNFALPEEIMVQSGEETGINVGQVTHFPLYFGEILSGAVLLIVMFIFLSWLFDRKVQV